MPAKAESPFARSRCYLLRCVVSRHIRESYLSFIAHTGSWARPNVSLCLQLFLLQRVFAGCCQSLLTDGPSRRYLLNLCIGAWTPTPPRFTGALTRFFPVNISLTFDATSSARETTASIAISMTNILRSCSHSFMFRLPYLLAPPIAPTADTLPVYQGSRDVYTTQ